MIKIANSNTGGNYKPCTLRSDKARTTNKQQQLPQNINLQVEAHERPEETVLRAGQRSDCDPVNIVIGSAYLERTTATRAATTSNASTEATNQA
jgi:hypothetical protein